MDFCRVGDAELFEEDGYFPWVWAGWMGSVKLGVLESVWKRTMAYDGRGG